MNHAAAYALAFELETARFIKKCREREARARFTDVPVLTGFDQLPEPSALAEKREAAASECRQEAAQERDAQRDEQMYGRL